MGILKKISGIGGSSTISAELVLPKFRDTISGGLHFHRGKIFNFSKNVRLRHGKNV
jgi:hypothetical protein